MSNLIRRVNLDHEAKIAWVMLGDMPLASFAFDAWGGANGASMAAHRWKDETDADEYECIKLLQAEVRLLRDALEDAYNLAIDDAKRVVKRFEAVSPSAISIWSALSSLPPITHVAITARIAKGGKQ